MARQTVTDSNGREYEILDGPDADSITSTVTKTGSSTSRNKRTQTEVETPPSREPISAPRPKKRAPATRPSGVTASQREAIKGLFAVTLGGGDLFAHALFPKYWTEQDRLKDYEGKLLVDGLWAEVSTHPKLLEILLTVGKQSGHAQLAGALALVALPRLANHGLLPPELAQMGSYFGLQLATLGANSIHMEPRPTHDSNSGDGSGEVHTNGVAEPTTEVQDSLTRKTRRSRVEAGTYSTNGSSTQNGEVR